MCVHGACGVDVCVCVCVCLCLCVCVCLCRLRNTQRIAHVAMSCVWACWLCAGVGGLMPHHASARLAGLYAARRRTHREAGVVVWHLVPQGECSMQFSLLLVCMYARSHLCCIISTAVCKPCCCLDCMVGMRCRLHHAVTCRNIRFNPTSSCCCAERSGTNWRSSFWGQIPAPNFGTKS